MNAKQARIARKGYKEAGHIYWKVFAIIEAPVLAYFIIEFFW